MARSARLGRVAHGIAVIVAIAGCGGRLINLGGEGVDGSAACPHAEVAADEVVWIGDSWILIPGNQHTDVRDLARAAGAIGPSDDYAIDAVAASTMAAVANQYVTAEAGATKVKVVIMDGGTWDTITANGSSASVTSAENGFGQFLTTVAADGTVQHIIYVLPPELPNIPGVAALRAPLVQACAQSTVPCHFLDAQQLWAGHPEYTASDGIFPTTAGATAVADAIWAIMQTSCIAQ
jgi:hypothetical protein